MNATGWHLPQFLLASALSSSVANAAAPSESDNFLVISRSSSHSAALTLKLCEAWRAALLRKWPSDADKAAWSPKCEVHIHNCRKCYLAAVGAGGAQTSASCQIQWTKNPAQIRRRIDIYNDSPQGLAALPHELTHLVLADLFDAGPPPRWADEGLAVLADSPGKQALRERDLAQAIARRTEFRLVELLAIEAYPQPSRGAVYCGQCASPARFLLARGDGPRMVEFLKSARVDGYDQALRRVYAIDGVSELKSQWCQWRCPSGATKPAPARGKSAQ
ncbi:MAG TPA: hypothetical protein VFV87_08990 [Pirellulaceae bacterium]|nr:hypothetical protein [Pirellulaceae bacterium]